MIGHHAVISETIDDQKANSTHNITFSKRACWLAIGDSVACIISRMVSAVTETKKPIAPHNET